MAFVGGDIQAALGAGVPQLVFQLDGTLDIDDAATLFGVGAVSNGEAEPPPPADPQTGRRRRTAPLRFRGRRKS